MSICLFQQQCPECNAMLRHGYSMRPIPESEKFNLMRWLNEVKDFLIVVPLGAGKYTIIFEKELDMLTVDNNVIGIPTPNTKGYSKAIINCAEMVKETSHHNNKLLQETLRELCQQ